MRDDSILYAGSSSASFGGKEQQIRKDKREEKETKRGLLKPVAEIVFKEIDAEKKSVMFVTNIAVEQAQDERLFMIEVMARKKYVEYLNRLQNKLDIILREPKGKDNE